jgi:hypothetical protein
MTLSSFLRLSSCALLLCSMSSFSGCDKENVSPRSGKDCHPTTTTPADTTTTTGTTTGGAS